MEEKKVFIIPEAIIVNFNNDDIVTASGDVDLWWGGKEGDEWWDD